MTTQKQLMFVPFLKHPILQLVVASLILGASGSAAWAAQCSEEIPGLSPTLNFCVGQKLYACQGGAESCEGVIITSIDESSGLPFLNSGSKTTIT
jgi:hypothetical protein